MALNFRIFESSNNHRTYKLVCLEGEYFRDAQPGRRQVPVFAGKT